MSVVPFRHPRLPVTSAPIVRMPVLIAHHPSDVGLEMPEPHTSGPGSAGVIVWIAAALGGFLLCLLGLLADRVLS